MCVCVAVCTSHWFYVLKIIVFVHRRSHSLVYLLHIFFLLVLSHPSIPTNLRLHFVAAVLHLRTSSLPIATLFIFFFTPRSYFVLLHTHSLTHSLTYSEWICIIQWISSCSSPTNDETTKNKRRDRKYNKVKKQQKNVSQLSFHSGHCRRLKLK